MLRWLAPETFQTKVTNEASDVWAFGVTAWEVPGKTLYLIRKSWTEGSLSKAIE